MGKMELVPPIVKDLELREKEASIFKDKLKEILDIPMPLNMLEAYKAKGIKLNGKSARILDGVTASLTLQALQGNVQAFTTIRDTMGYKPVDRVQNDVVVRIDMSQTAKELGE